MLEVQLNLFDFGTMLWQNKGMKDINRVMNSNDNDTRRQGYQMPEIDPTGAPTGKVKNIGPFIPFAQTFIKQYAVGDWKHWPNSQPHINKELMIASYLQYATLEDYYDGWREIMTNAIAYELQCHSQTLLTGPVFEEVEKTIAADASAKREIEKSTPQLAKTYHENGVLRTEAIFVNNDIHGYVKSYDNIGQLLTVTSFEHGIMHGMHYT